MPISPPAPLTSPNGQKHPPPLTPHRYLRLWIKSTTNASACQSETPEILLGLVTLFMITSFHR